MSASYVLEAKKGKSVVEINEYYFSASTVMMKHFFL